MRLIPSACLKVTELHAPLRVAALLLTVALPPGPALAQDSQPPNPLIQNTIRQQLDAFNAKDSPRAFTFASPTIKGIFGTADTFGNMVQQGYPMVWSHIDVQMLELRFVAGNLWQRVMITDGQGRTHLLDYKMIDSPQGWQIDAVQLLPQAGTGA